MTWARRALLKRRLLITHILKSHLSSLTLWRLEEDKRRALRCRKYSSLFRTLSHHLQIKASSHNSIHSHQNPYSKHRPAHHITPLFILALHTQNNQQPTNKTNNTIAMASTLQISAAPQHSTSSHSSLKNVAQKVIGAVKQHNKEVNAAYQAYYGMNYHPSVEYLKKGQASRAPVTVSQQ
jgi:hypothetical protein